jgi:hypothetical protein
MNIPRRAIYLALSAIGLAFGAVSGAAAKASIWDLFDRDSSGKISPAERRALIDFYNATGGDSTWNHHDGWMGSAGSECTWYGITCNSEHVIAIELDGNNLQGPLSDLSALTGLKRFAVRHNRLRGSLASLSKLPSLRILSVADNEFTGALPALSDLHSLEYFHAGYNHWTGSIPSLIGLANLETFSVMDSELSGSIPPLDGLTNLDTLELHGNRLSGAIPSLAGLSALETLNLSNNQLTGPIPSLHGLSKLRSVQIENNQLDGTMPDAPVPNELVRGDSHLCPNRLAPTSAVQWDRATGSEPWYKSCASAQDQTASTKIAK